MVYNTTSIKSIIAKIYRDFKPNNSSWVGDAIEWTGEAIQAIGSFQGFVEQGTYVKIIDYRGKLPCDIEYLLGVEYNGKRLERNGGINTSQVFVKSINDLPVDLQNSYNLNPNYIRTSFKEGKVIVYYLGIEVDNEGLPKVPDIYEVKEAISWYVMYRMLLRGYKHPVITYDKAEAKWNEFMPKAQNACNFPDIDAMETFKKSYMGLARTTNLTNEMFDTILDSKV